MRITFIMCKYRLGSRLAVTAYVAIGMAVLAGMDFLFARYSFPPVQPTSVGTNPLLNRLAWYKQHASQYDVIFIGDSRTYCNIHPEAIDPILGTKSLNLGAFTNWFPTQLSMVQDLAPSIPRGTTIVWSIGGVNFAPMYTRVGNAVPGPAQRTYPVGFRNAVRYIWWGLSPFDLADNLLFYSPALYFLTQRGEIRKSFIDLLGFRLGYAAADSSQGAPGADDSAVRDLQREYLKDERVAAVQVLSDAGKITSVVLYHKGGGYYRIELDPDYFARRKQELAEGTSLAGVSPRIDPAYWKMFEDILRTLKDKNIRLVVNELEEAPFVYGDRDHRERWRRFMREQIEPRVVELGVPYLRVDFDQLRDVDYFDFDHLNSRGIEKFMPLLAGQLAPHLEIGLHESALSSKTFSHIGR